MIRDQALAASGLLVDDARRPAGQAVPAAGRLGGSDVRQQAVSAGPRRGPLPPQPLHLLAADRRPDRVLRHRRAPDLRRQADPHEHAAARPDDAERRDLRRGRPGAGRARAARRPALARASASSVAFRLVLGRRPTADETDGPARQPGPGPRASSPPTREAAKQLLARRRVAARRAARPGRARRLHGASAWRS